MVGAAIHLSELAAREIMDVKLAGTERALLVDLCGGFSMCGLARSDAFIDRPPWKTREVSNHTIYRLHPPIANRRHGGDTGEGQDGRGRGRARDAGGRALQPVRRAFACVCMYEVCVGVYCIVYSQQRLRA